MVSERNSGGFTPSMPLSSPAPAMPQQTTADDASLVQVLLTQQKLMLELREEKSRQDAKVEKAELRQEMEAKMQRHQIEMQERADAHYWEKMREELKPPVEAITKQQLVALQDRLEVLHAAKLLGSAGDDELWALEDIVADYVEFVSSIGGVATLELIHTNEHASKLLKLVALSESIAADRAFARQARRKYV